MKTQTAVVTWTGAATKSMGATITSDPFPVKNMITAALAVTVSASSSPVGTFSVEGCCEEGNDPGTGLNNVSGLTNWVAIPGYTQAITADGTTIFDMVDVSVRWLRIVYTRTSGSATAAARANVKGGRNG